MLTNTNFFQPNSNSNGRSRRRVMVASAILFVLVVGLAVTASSKNGVTPKRKQAAQTVTTVENAAAPTTDNEPKHPWIPHVRSVRSKEEHMAVHGDIRVAIPEKQPAWTIQPISAVPADYNMDTTFYTRCIDVNGFFVVGSNKPSDAALRRAADTALFVARVRPDILTKLGSLRIRLTVMATTENTLDVPEHNFLKDPIYNPPNNNDPEYWNKRARGLGANGPGTAMSCAEENLLRLPWGDVPTGDRYHNEDICIHEFAHTMFMYGEAYIHPSSQIMLTQIFANAEANDLWNTPSGKLYSRTNEQEYWAEGIQYYFEANYPPAHSLANWDYSLPQKKALELYDPSLYGLIAHVVSLPRVFYLKDKGTGKFVYPPSSLNGIWLHFGALNDVDTAYQWHEVGMLIAGATAFENRKNSQMVMQRNTCLNTGWVNHDTIVNMWNSEGPNAKRQGFLVETGPVGDVGSFYLESPCAASTTSPVFLRRVNDGEMRTAVGKPSAVVWNFVARSIYCGQSVMDSIAAHQQRRFEFYTFPNTRMTELRISTCHPDTKFDTIVDVYDGSGSTTRLRHFDDTNHHQCGTYYREDIKLTMSASSFPIAIGKRYDIAVGGYSSNSGVFRLTVTCK